MIKKLRSNISETSPLIHCITNPISINQCANVILAAGARPMMAEHPKEAAEITRTAGALMLNIGNITDVRMESMQISAETAKEYGIPYLIDLCGAACLSSRREFALEIIKKFPPSVIKGNYSEINALYDADYSSSGVDADVSLSEDTVVNAAVKIAEKYHSAVLASGKTDIVTDGKKLILIHNGTPQLSRITGTGCMQGALCAAYLPAAFPADAAAAACAVFGICGQISETEKGSGTFFVDLMDALSSVSDSTIEKYLDMEEKQIENN